METCHDPASRTRAASTGRLSRAPTATIAPGELSTQPATSLMPRASRASCPRLSGSTPPISGSSYTSGRAVIARGSSNQATHPRQAERPPRQADAEDGVERPPSAHPPRYWGRRADRRPNGDPAAAPAGQVVRPNSGLAAHRDPLRDRRHAQRQRRRRRRAHRLPNPRRPSDRPDRQLGTALRALSAVQPCPIGPEESAWQADALSHVGVGVT